MSQKRALISGISGQDGAYLAQLLLKKGYEVYGTARDAQMASFYNLEILGIRNQVKTESMALNDFRSVLQTLAKIKPDELYNLAGQSSVGLSFQQPVETLESISVGTLNLLEAIRFLDSPIRFYNAGSGECFGDIGGAPADEETPFRPRSPYAVAKATAFWEVANYREAYGIYACSGILFNHESALRPERFVTKKIVNAVRRIADGSKEKLHLGNISVSRDWGWAPEYVDAMWRILQQDTPDDFVIATGETYSLEDFIATAFNCAGLDWKQHVVTDSSLLRPSEITVSRANPSKAFTKLGWKAQLTMPQVVRVMFEDRHELDGCA
ncbi:GDP-mannose 4,6-dehydratase [Geomonas edaphica]|uniref:GDP-mannose 4,6-dehydratase n=1 Tax=Geomonas edaphica TaxID=2570226 RepID=UPI0010A795E1|nr:GDP-mannose 4,6-dehydratase [Geomonas edaphica]